MKKKKWKESRLYLNEIINGGYNCRFFEISFQEHQLHCFRFKLFS